MSELEEKGVVTSVLPEQASSAAAAFNPRVGPPKPRVLIVEDELVTQQILADQLRAAGFVVDTADTMSGALLLLAENLYEVALLDMFLPDGTGSALQNELMARHARIEVVLMTARPSVHDAVACLGTGAFDYLSKPIESSKLLAVIHAAIGRRHRSLRLNTLEAVQGIFATSTAEDLAKAIVAAAMQALDADDASLLVPTPAGELTLAYSRALGPSPPPKVGIPSAANVAAMVAAQRGPVVVSSPLTADPRFAEVPPSSRPIRASIVYPLLVRGRLLGVLCINRLVSRHWFSPADLVEAGVVATRAALALDNVRLLADLNARVAELAEAQTRTVGAQRLAAIGQLAAGIAHEINNPVAFTMANVEFVSCRLSPLVAELAAPGAQGAALEKWLEQLGGKPGLEELLRALAEAHDGTVRIRDIVGDIRQLARSEASSDAKADLAQAIRTAVRLATPTIRGRAAVEVDLCPQLVIQGSVAQLSQVFLNLLVNAAQATSAAHRTGAVIKIAARREGERAVITVADNGVGMTAETQARIFVPFFSTKPPDEGTGLGLSISRDTVRRHGGDITFTSEPDVGTTFTVVLPATTSDTELQAAPIEEASGGAASGRNNAPRKRLLIVEDEENMRHAYMRFFGAQHDLAFAWNGFDAAKILAYDRAFDLIICDVIMPEMNGIELYRHVAGAFPGLEKRFVFATGGFGRQDVRDFVASIPNVVLHKPFSFEKILDQLRVP